MATYIEVMMAMVMVLNQVIAGTIAVRIMNIIEEIKVKITTEEKKTEAIRKGKKIETIKENQKIETIREKQKIESTREEQKNKFRFLREKKSDFFRTK